MVGYTPKCPNDVFGLYTKVRELRSCAMSEGIYLAIFTYVNGTVPVAQQVV